MSGKEGIRPAPAVIFMEPGGKPTSMLTDIPPAASSAPPVQEANNPIVTENSPVTDIVWYAEDCPPLTPSEIMAAMTDRDTSHHHLATSVVLHCLGRVGTILEAHEARTAAIKLQTASVDTQRLQTRFRELMPAVTLYERILGQVRDHDIAFRRQYFDSDGEADIDALDELETQTNATQNPALACIKAITQETSEPRRYAARQATWILRHMLLEAFEADTRQE